MKKPKGNQARRVPRPYLGQSGLRTGPPDEMRLILRYNQSPIITSTTGIGVNYLFRGNSIFDPDLTGTGAQPAYYVELQQIYFRYRVHSCKIVATVIPTGNYLTDCVLAALPTTSPMTTTVTLESLKAQKYVKNGFVGSGMKPLEMRMNVGTAEIFGQPVSVVNVDDTFTADVTTNPARTWIYQFACQNVDLSSTSQVRVNFQLEYDVTLYNRISVIQ